MIKKIHGTSLVMVLFPLITCLSLGVFFSANCLALSCTDEELKSCIGTHIASAPGGAVPTEDASQITNCKKLDSITAKGVDRDNGGLPEKCPAGSESGEMTTYFCPAKTASVSTASGKVVIYAGGTGYFISFKNITTGESIDNIPVDGSKSNTPYELGITIHKGDQYYFVMHDNTNQGTGWRAYNGVTQKSFFDAAEADASGKYTIISEQTWSDSLTCSMFDSYDFDDAGIIVAVYNPTPSCSNNTIGLSTTNTILGKTATFSINKSDIDSSTYYRAISNIFSPGITLTTALNGSPCALNSTINNCFIQNRITYNAATYTTDITWSHNYKVCSDSTEIFCNTCTSTTNFNIYPYPSFLKTTASGTAFVAGTVNQSVFPTSQTFTSQLFLTRATNLNGYKPLTNISGQSKLINYNDSNNRSDYFAYYSKKISSDQSIHLINTNTITITNSYLQNLAIQPNSNKVDVISVTGNLIIGGASATTVYCHKPTIFLVSGDLIFDQEFKISPGSDTGCLFIVGGNTKINMNIVGAKIEAFIISNSITTNTEGSITIKGGVVLQGGAQTNIFNKNVNATITDANNIGWETPSEVLQYEGARYIKLFGEYLKEPIQLSIKEIQYSN